jgi:hypothetical protein
MSPSPRCPARLAARLLLWLVLALGFLHGQATASPIIVARPDSIGPLEVPACAYVSLPLQISDRDSLGPTPLSWTISDVAHGTSSDVPWVTQSSTSGTIAPAGSEGVLINIDMCGLAGGEYLVDLRLDSNDPIHSRLVVPMTLFVVVPVPVHRRTFGEIKTIYR